MDNILINDQYKKLIIDHLYTIEGYSTLYIAIKSGVFEGASNFCVSGDAIDSVIKDLSLMNKSLEGRCEIMDYDSDAYIILEMDKYGHLNICGQIGGSHEDQFMKFKYESDQTILVNLIRIFKSLQQ